MRMIAGSILVLAGAVLYAAHWLGRAAHTPSASGSPEAWYLAATAFTVGLVGAAVAALDLIGHELRDGDSE